MGRYYGFEDLRNKRLQKKAINYGLKTLTPMIEDAGGKPLDHELSTKIRPKKAYKTNRKDLGDPDPYKMGGSLKDDLIKTRQIMENPEDYNDQRQKLAKYAWEQVRIYGIKLSFGQFLTTLGLTDVLKKDGDHSIDARSAVRMAFGYQGVGDGIIDKAKEKGADKLTKSGVAGSPWCVD